MTDSRTRVLITGASGLIGGLVLKNLGDKYEFSALNRRLVEGIPCVQADIADFDAMSPAFEGIETVLHGIAGGEQERALQAPGGQRLGGLVDDVDQRHVDPAGHLGRDQMHGVGADQHAVGTGLLQAAGAGRQGFGREIPATGLLEGDDLGKIDRMQEHVRGGESADAFAYHLVDHAVVDRRALKAHAADQANRLHLWSPSGEWQDDRARQAVDVCDVGGD